ncbi:dTDP-4-dehydrorhamnose 3,5-epimerase [Polynucleobacter sp. es-MAR-4]|uniref:dTDP-4-dehydrorhamnose 3,5-epimerase n=1 Tax=Polynucleobacter sp. es-MAR-4 TaxID=1855655 RepID=UPI001C0CF9D5|nr:dTDP-4-dehydrorhamnose 3,5-epimerase [Polynucleobacter sp. es-MAR-4]MBU3637573.1 dTDP-4-dehydrorhamnose 3,5-epimerase [Polynucleobacter sp. es-MAR-4]
MDAIKTQINGCFELQPKIFDDARGRFIKVFNQNVFEENHLETIFSEEFYSTSINKVVRGLHFQSPPYDQVKLVYCPYGEIFDVVVDLRMESPTYGKYATFIVSSKKANSIYIPKGMAHGFYVKSEIAVVSYLVSHVYSEEHDLGIKWNSVGIPWPSKNAILSTRDAEFPCFENFISPFNKAWSEG